ncbi:MAG: flippase [bacterium]
MNNQENINTNNHHFRKIITNTSFLFGAEMYRRIIRIALVIFAARLLGDEGYGKFAFALAFVKLFLIFTDAGIHQLLIRELARKKELIKKYVGNALLIKIGLCILTSFAIVVIMHLSNKPPDVIYTVYFITLNHIFASFSLIFESIFQARERMKYVAFGNVISATVSTLFGIGILVAGGDYIALAMMYAVAGFFKLVYCIFISNKYFTKIKILYDFRIIKFILKEGMPIGINLIFATIYTLVDQVMLSFMYNDEVVGWYRAAYQFVFTMTLIPEQLLKAAFPVLSKYFVKSLADLKILFNRLLKFLLLAALSLATFILDLIRLLYGNEYINGANALQILVWSTAFIYINLIFANTVRAINKQRFTARIVMMGAVINVMLNFILIPKYGITGAAFSTLITEILVFTTHFIFLYRNIIQPPVLRYLPKVLLINGIMVLFVILFQGLNFFILFFVSMFLNLIMIFICKYFTKNELNFFKNFFFKKNRNNGFLK